LFINIKAQGSKQFNQQLHPRDLTRLCSRCGNF